MFIVCQPGIYNVPVCVTTGQRDISVNSRHPIESISFVSDESIATQTENLK